MEISHLMLLVEILLITSGGYFINFFMQRVLLGFQRSNNFNESLLIPISGLIKWFIIVLVILLICRQFGISITVILTSLSGILLLVAIGFVAVWSVLSNVSCSFLLLVFPPFSFGDTIEIKDPDKESGMKGKVIALNLFYTTLKSIDENGKESLIRVPNNLFFQRIIICHSGEHTEALKVTMNDSYVDGKSQ
jgi:small-conductance mechanosensitive channel